MSIGVATGVEGDDMVSEGDVVVVGRRNVTSQDLRLTAAGRGPGGGGRRESGSDGTIITNPHVLIGAPEKPRVNNMAAASRLQPLGAAKYRWLASCGQPYAAAERVIHARFQVHTCAYLARRR